MTTQLLATELANLIQESKRKHNDLRQVRVRVSSHFAHAHRGHQAAEKSLDELKQLGNISEQAVPTGTGLRYLEFPVIVVNSPRRALTKSQLCESLHHCLRIQECQVHGHRHCVPAAAHCLASFTEFAAEPSPGSSHASFIGWT